MATLLTPTNIVIGLGVLLVLGFLVQALTSSHEDELGASSSCSDYEGTTRMPMAWQVAPDGGPYDRWPSPKSALPGGNSVRIGSKTGHSYFPNQFWLDSEYLLDCSSCDGRDDGEQRLVSMMQSSQDLIYGDQYGRSRCPYEMVPSKFGTGCGPQNSDLQGLARIAE